MPLRLRVKRLFHKTEESHPSDTQTPPNTDPTVTRSVKLKGIWDDALEQLREKEPKLIEAYESYLLTSQKQPQQPDDTDLEPPLQTLVQQKLDDLQHSRRRFTVAGKEVVLRDKALSVLNPIISFKDSISAAVTAEQHAALAWAGVLPLSRALTSQEHAMQGFEQISNFLIRYRVIECTHIEISVPQTSSSPTERIDRLTVSLREKIVNLYTEILRYQIRLVHQFSHSAVMQFFKDLTIADDWKEMLSSITETDRSITDDLRVLSGHTLRRIDTAVGELHSQIETSLTMLSEVRDETKAAKQSKLIDGLPYVAGALFDSYEDGHKPKCLDGTQIATLEKIQVWVDNPREPPIFWLNGMAGTGKSTISRTFAEATRAGKHCTNNTRLADDIHLAASFFFDYSKPDRNNAQRLFTTLSRSLATVLPDLRGYICDALEKSRTSRPSKYESLLPVLPEKQIRLGFQKLLSRNLVERLNLQKILLSSPGIPLKDDITLYLEHELSEIRKRNGLSLDWPRDRDMKELAQRADGLFIFVSTAIRFLSPPKLRKGQLILRLRKVCDNEIASASPQENLDQIYTRILQFSLMGEGALPEEEQEAISLFRKTVGSVILLVEPLSVEALSGLTFTEKESVTEILESLYSILSLPEGDASGIVQPLHLSFRDYLLDSRRCLDKRFWIEETSQHQFLLHNCLSILSETLRQDVCRVRNPVISIDDVSVDVINEFLPRHVQYASLYWVDHLRQSNAEQYDNGEVHTFLKAHLLDWIEAILLLRKGHECVMKIRDLLFFVSSQSHVEPELHAMVADTLRFVLTFKSMIEATPLRYTDRIPKWANLITKTNTQWGPLLQTLGDEWMEVTMVMFSADGKFVLAAEYGIRLWDPATGTLLMQLKLKNWVLAATFSSDSKKVVLQVFKFPSTQEPILGNFSPDCTLLALSMYSHDDCTYQVSLLDVINGTLLQTFPNMEFLEFVTFSLDGRLLGFGSEQNVHVLDIATGRFSQVSQNVTSVAVFSPDGRLLPAIPGRLWDPTAAQSPPTLLPTTMGAVASSNGKVLAIRPEEGTCNLWNPTTGEYLKTLDIGLGTAPALSSDGRLLRLLPWKPDYATTDSLDTTQLWDTETGTLLETLEDHFENVTSAAVSPDGKLMVSVAHTSAVQLWDLSVRSLPRTPERHLKAIRSALFSLDGKLAATVPDGQGGIKLWDPVTGALLHTLSEPDDRSTNFQPAVAFSQDGKLLGIACRIYGGPRRFYVWDTTTASLVWVGVDTSRHTHSIAFSPDNTMLVSVSWEAAYMWNILTGHKEKLPARMPGHLCSVAFSPAGGLLALGSDTNGIQIWNLVTQTLTKHLMHPAVWHSLAFSPDGQLLASSSDLGLIVWDLNTGDELGQRKFDNHLSPKIEPTTYTHSLSFSSDGQTLIQTKASSNFPAFAPGSCVRRV
ncbi:hypothetical protein BDW59DRAFT_160926 [Aspergillus cavernicola]|uniref:Mitochondrial division protein 1 n=1 Tax=Aspergillus cavernicola TaxID=176166 RepID=A0ABR4IF56_9EURO